jgi:hypothetical protein
MSKAKIKVKVTCHEEFLVIETVDPTADENFIPYGGSKVGCVLIDTEKYLGMSDEAFKLIKTLHVSGDDIGDISTHDSVKGQSFSWLGPVKRLLEIPKCDTSSDGIIDIKYIKIENKIPIEAFESIVRTKALREE